MELSRLEVVPAGGQVRIQCQVIWRGGEDTLWYTIDRRYASHLEDQRYDGPLVGLLLKAMALGEDVEIRGALSERLHFNLTHYYTDVLREMQPALRPVAIHAERLDPGTACTRPSGVGTGFSAGIDSFAALHDHFLHEQLPGYRITHLLFNNVGSHGDRHAEAARRLFHQRWDAVRDYPQSVGLEFIRVDSNLSDLLQMNFEYTHTPRNLSVVLLLGRLFGRYYYASAFRYRDCCVGPNEAMACCDPVAVHLLSTETLDCVATGSQHSRVEKTRLVTRVPGASRWLNVCTSVAAHGRNCSTCQKCCRTLLTLELLGELEPFGAVFDLDTWRRVRNRYIRSRILARSSQDALTREIREYVAATGIRFTARQHAAAAQDLLPHTVLKLGRSFRRYLGGS